MDAALSDQIKKSIEYERNRTRPPDGFPKLPDIPARRYTDPAFFELERKHIWRRSWLCVGHQGEMPVGIDEAGEQSARAELVDLGLAAAQGARLRPVAHPDDPAATDGHGGDGWPGIPEGHDVLSEEQMVDGVGRVRGAARSSGSTAAAARPG